VRRPGAGQPPFLVLQAQRNPYPSRQLRASFDLTFNGRMCEGSSVFGPLVAGDLDGAPDPRAVPDNDQWQVESAAVGDLEPDGDNDVLTGRYVNQAATARRRCTTGAGPPGAGLDSDGLPDLLVTDATEKQLMIYVNASTTEGSPCTNDDPTRSPTRPPSSRTPGSRR
jgi:hypothetical protein